MSKHAPVDVVLQRLVLGGGAAVLLHVLQHPPRAVLIGRLAAQELFPQAAISHAHIDDILLQ